MLCVRRACCPAPASPTSSCPTWPGCQQRRLHARNRSSPCSPAWSTSTWLRCVHTH